MARQFIFRISFILFLTLSINFVSGQNSFNAFITQEGNLSFRVTKSGFYLNTSEKGKITGYGALSSGTISYDFSGRVDKIGTLAISYDFSRRIEKIGTTNISYDFSGRVDKIGTTSISYDFSGKVEKIGGQSISYNFNGKVEKIGSTTISYNFSGNVDKINDDEGFVVFIPKNKFRRIRANSQHGALCNCGWTE